MNLNIICVPVKIRAWSFPLYLVNMRNVEYTSGGWVCPVTKICDYSNLASEEWGRVCLIIVHTVNMFCTGIVLKI